jgi:RNA polymerase sigma-70 factor (ECF subfamily)
LYPDGYFLPEIGRVWSPENGKTLDASVRADISLKLHQTTLNDPSSDLSTQSDGLADLSSGWSTSADEVLIEGIQRRQVEALQEVYRRHGRLVYALAMRVLRTSEEAEDLTQEIFLQLWQKPSYDASRGKLSTYLSLMTRSRAIDRVRSHGSRFRLLQRWTATHIQSGTCDVPLEQADRGEQARRVRTAMAELSATDREILENAYYEGLSQSQIAERLNLPLGTVKTRSRNALKKLRKELQDFI